MANRYWHVDIYAENGDLDHNCIISSFDEFATLSLGGRTVKFTGEATASEFFAQEFTPEGDLAATSPEYPG